MGENTFLGSEPVEVPGEIVVSLKSEAAGGVMASIPAGPGRGLMAGPTSFGSSGIDGALARAGVTEIRSVHGPLPPAPLGMMAGDAEASVDNTFRVRFDPKNKVSTLVDKLNALDEVEYAEPVVLYEATVIPNDPRFGQQWGLTKIRCPEAWDITTGNASVVVAVVDTGVDLDHPELAALLLPGQDLVDLGPSPAPPRPGWVWEGDFNGRDAQPDDEVGHGTHVAGTIASRTNEGAGVAGVTWNCRLLPVKVLNRARRLSDGRVSGFGMSVDIAAGIRWAADHGARIINLSLGGPTRAQVTADAVAYAISRGCLVVAAMGNEGNAVPQFPASLPGVLAVAAVDSADQRAGFSSMGPHCAVAAPGVDVWSTMWDNTHTSMSGTSMATPHVSGVAALLLSCNGALTAAQLRDAIVQTARPLRDNPGDPVPNDQYGAGLIDARAALERVGCRPRRSIRIIDCDTPVLSRIVRCEVASRTVICDEPRITRMIRCTSLVVRCDEPRISQAIRCPEPVSQTVRCLPSAQVDCVPSAMVRCEVPSIAAACPSLVCRFPGRDPYLGGGLNADDDPYGTNYGQDW